MFFSQFLTFPASLGEVGEGSVLVVLETFSRALFSFWGEVLIFAGAGELLRRSAMVLVAGTSLVAGVSVLVVAFCVTTGTIGVSDF